MKRKTGIFFCLLFGISSYLYTSPLPMNFTRQDVKKLCLHNSSTYDIKRSTWKAEEIKISGKTPENRKEIISWNFNNDTDNISGFKGIKNIELKNGCLTFTTLKGSKFYFGNYFGNQPDIPSLTIGKKLREYWYPLRLSIRIKQGLSQSHWKVEYRSGLGRSRYRVTRERILSGTNWQEVTFNLGDSRRVVTSICINTREPGNNIQIDWIKVYTPSATQCFRKTIEIPDIPVDAKLSIFKNPQYKIYINGVLVKQSCPKRGVYLTNYENLGSYFRKGKNVIAVESEYYTWSSPAETLLIEGMIRLRNGKIIILKTDKTWKGKFNAPSGWEKLNYDDTLWGNCISKGKPKGAYGKRSGYFLNPPYYGPIELENPNNKYFIYDFKKGVNISVKVYPNNFKDNYDLTWYLKDANTNKLVKKGILTKNYSFNSLFNGKIETNVDKPGVYDLFVNVISSNKVVEKRVEEVAVVGKILQREVEGKTYTEGMELELVDEIDCADENSPYRFFSQNVRGEDIPSPIRETKLGKYRETGKGCYDWFGFAVKLEHLYQPHLVEVEIPDDKERIMSVRVVEMSGTAQGLRNDGSGYRGWGINAPGVYTGIDHPLTYKMIKLRFIIYPKVPVTGFIFMNQMGGLRAAVSKIRIYWIRNGLPALKIGSPSYRLTGQHTERITIIPHTFYAGEDDFKFCVNLSEHMHRGFYKDWYNSIENLIKYMRFTGENMIIAGIYMYYPWCGNMWAGKKEANAIELLARMLDANGMKVLLGIEYATNRVVDMHQYTNSEVANGAKTMLTVSKDGKQTRNWNGTANLLAPGVKEDLLNVVKELVNLYKDTPGIAGIAFQEGAPYLPSISYDVKSNNPLDWGYGDYTISLFEKETGIKIPVDPKDPDRFMKRYNFLMKNYKEEWITWRNKKVFEVNQRISDIIHKGNNKWEMCIFPRVNCMNLGNKEKFSVEEIMRDDSFDPSLYAQNKEILFGNVYYRRIRFYTGSKKNFLLARQWSNNPETLKICDNGTAYITDGFFEATQRSKTWYYDVTLACDKVCPQGRYFLDSFNRVLRYATPQVLAQTWLDCQMMSGHEQERREFNRAFQVLPPGTYKRLTGNGLDKNIFIRAAKKKEKTFFYVVNPAGWGIDVVLKVKINRGGNIRDLSLGKILLVKNNKISFLMKPYEMKSFSLSKGKVISAKVNVTDKDRQSLEKFAKEKISLYTYCKKMNPEFLKKALAGIGLKKSIDEILELAEKVEQAGKEKDYLTIANITKGYPLSQLEKFLKLKMDSDISLSVKPTYYINCGAIKIYTDKKGHCWLPDQPWLNGAMSWGYIGGGTADRGNIQIKGTTNPQIYRTERYGVKGYRFKVSNGTYIVRLHFAETWTCKQGGRIFDVIIQGKKVLSNFDVYQAAGGRKIAVVKNFLVKVNNGILSIDFSSIRNAPEINGIEVIKIR